MKLATILAISVVYWSLVGVAFFYVSFQCGMGPDSPASCNASADRQASLLIGGAAMLYFVSLVLVWTRRRTGV